MATARILERWPSTHAELHWRGLLPGCTSCKLRQLPFRTLTNSFPRPPSDTGFRSLHLCMVYRCLPLCRCVDTMCRKFMHTHAYTYLYLSFISICISICLSVYLSICLSIHLSIYLSICIYVYIHTTSASALQTTLGLPQQIHCNVIEDQTTLDILNMDLIHMYMLGWPLVSG